MSAEQADRREAGELLQTWVGVRFQEVDALVEEGRAKVASLPDRRGLESVIGELIVRVRALELDVADLRGEIRR